MRIDSAIPTVESDKMIFGVVSVLMNGMVGDRAQEAKTRVEGDLKALVKSAGLVYPPKQLFFRAFKQERILEVWAGSSTATELKKLKSYPILAASGQLGPKRQEGDGQVPEGLYHIERFNPKSLFHLSLGLNYPNASDKILTTNPSAPGSDIFIHGNAKSIGCLAMGDPAIEEIYTLARAAKNKVYVLILPAQLNPNEQDPFWQQIYAINASFKKSHRLPSISIDRKGIYHVR